MKKIILILSVVLLTGCFKDSQSTTSEGIEFQVEFLFEKDGVRVYRFFDGGHARYFTTKGETMTTHGSKSEFDENIKTNLDE